VKDRWEVTAQLPSEAFIQCVCAFTYMNASSRRNLSDAPTTEMNGARNGPDKGSALGGVTGMARSRRMVVTCMWGVSDPLRAARGAKKGAAKWGSLTPPLSLRSAATAARTRYRRHRAPPAPDPRPLTGKNIEARLSCRRQRAVPSPGRPMCQTGGNGAPEFRFPHPVPPSRVQTRATRESEGGR
jgi:hypothetical protein